MAVNGLLHHRLRRNGTVTWRWLLFLSAMDVALITAAVIIGGEFHLFSYVAYYPALAFFAVVFTSLPLSLGWTTVVAIVYAGVSLTVGSGLEGCWALALRRTCPRAGPRCPWTAPTSPWTATCPCAATSPTWAAASSPTAPTQPASCSANPPWRGRRGPLPAETR